MDGTSFCWLGRLGAGALVILAAAGCDDRPDPTATPEPALARAARARGAPSPLVSVGPLQFWPFTGNDFSGTAQDPINLIFQGQTDPRGLRGALMMLGGDRSAFGLPNVPPFNCTWQDAIGGVQTTYATGSGWVASAIQLACGAYGPIRFHLRFFDVGGATLGGAHFEVLIPGTTEHQVLSWELAEQLVTVDFLRSGLLAAPVSVTGVINPAPTFRDIPAVIYNGLPVELRGAIGGPPGDVSGPVGIATDGHGTTLNLAASVSGEPGIAVQDFDIAFDQVIPKPFCAGGPADFIYAQGPIHLHQQVVLTPSGNYLSQFHAVGHLNLTPVNPLTSPPSPLGETYRAVVEEHHRSVVTDNVTMASSFMMQIEIPPSGPFRGRLQIAIDVGPGGSSHASASIGC